MIKKKKKLDIMPKKGVKFEETKNLTNSILLILSSTNIYIHILFYTALFIH